MSSNGDSVTLESNDISFGTQSIFTEENMMEHAKLFVPKLIEQLGEDNFRSQVIECVGEMKIYNIDLDTLETDIDDRTKE